MSKGSEGFALWARKVLKFDRPFAGGLLGLTALRAEGCGGAHGTRLQREGSKGSEGTKGSQGSKGCGLPLRGNKYICRRKAAALP